MRGLFFSLFISIMLSGCSKTIEGDVFYKSGENTIKASDVDLYLFDPSEFGVQVQKRKEEIADEIAYIEGRIASNKDSIAKLEELQRKLFAASLNMAMSGGWNTNTVGGVYQQNKQDQLLNQSSESIGRSSDAVSNYKNEIDEWNKEIERIKNGSSGKYYFPVLNDRQPVAKTNADGRFKFETKGSDGQILVAKTKEKIWIIKLSSDQKNISLTDSNESSHNCVVCAEYF